MKNCCSRSFCQDMNHHIPTPKTKCIVRKFCEKNIWFLLKLVWIWSSQNLRSSQAVRHCPIASTWFCISLQLNNLRMITFYMKKCYLHTICYCGMRCKISSRSIFCQKNTASEEQVATTIANLEVANQLVTDIGPLLSHIVLFFISSQYL